MEKYKGKKIKPVPILSVVNYLLLVITVCIFITYLCTEDIVVVRAQRPGMTDLTNFDFSNQIAQVATESTQSIYIYSGVFYMPEDFTSAQPVSGVLYDRTEGAQGDYGTLRMKLMLPPGHVYAIAAKSVSYAQRLFIDGKEYTSVGVPSDRKEGVIPQSRRFVQTFLPGGETTEIVIHYASFVHGDGGGLYPINVGYAEDIARSEQLGVFRAAVAAGMMGTIMIFFFGLFLFFRSHQYLLWFSLLCGGIAVRLLGEKTLGLLLPDLSWYLIIRTAYISNCCIGLLSMLYIRSLFPDVIKKWVIQSVFVFFIASVLLIAFVPTNLFTRFPVALSLVYAAMVGYILTAALVQHVRGKCSSALSLAELRLLLAGVVIFALFFLLDIFTFQRSLLLFGLEYQTAGMILFIFINMLALVLGFSHAEGQLDTLRKREWEIIEANRMLERLNQAKSEFLGNISHEMKTPLTVMSNYAGLTRNQLRRNLLNAESENNLDMIQQEAVRLGRLVEQLMALSLKKKQRQMRTLSDIRAVLLQAEDFCRSLCQGSGNRILVQMQPENISLWVNEDSLFHVLVNLITNANRHMEGGTITLSTACLEKRVYFEVSDTGEGIAPELLDHVFERGVSGSGSSGLGLPICKEIIEDQGGSIEIESSGSGTRVFFTLPRQEGRDWE